MINLKMLNDHLDIYRGLIMMAYPGYHGLGEYEPIRVILENQEEFDERMDVSDDLAFENTTLWIVSKELDQKKCFADYFGKNEKQKLVAKL